MRLLQFVLAFVLGIAFAAGGASLWKHRTALQQAEAARAELERDAREKGQRIALSDAELTKLRTDVTALEAKAAGIEATKAELAEVRKAKEDAEARSALYDQFVRKFKAQIDAGHLSLGVRRGRIVLALQSEVLFDTGKAEITGEGRAALAEIAIALRTVKGRRFQVSGHTDTLPISTPQFPSNWELSSARAVEVVKHLVAEGVPPVMLSATGYGEFEPTASNGTTNGRAKNRRIEITLEPSIGDMTTMPQMKM